jgi:hypothetical protein
MEVDKAAEGKRSPVRLRSKPSTVPLSWLTVEVALYILIGVVAAGLRFYALGAQPLRESEAAQALAAWRFVGLGIGDSGFGIQDSGYSPLLFLGNVFTLARSQQRPGSPGASPLRYNLGYSALLPAALPGAEGSFGGFRAPGPLALDPLFLTLPGGRDGRRRLRFGHASRVLWLPG